MLKLIQSSRSPIERGDVDVDGLRELLAEVRIRTVRDFDPRVDSHINLALLAIVSLPELLATYEAYHASRGRPSGQVPRG